VKVREYRQGLVDEPLMDENQGEKKKKHITFA
jgi:hypothetical protein